MNSIVLFRGLPMATLIVFTAGCALVVLRPAGGAPRSLWSRPPGDPRARLWRFAWCVLAATHAVEWVFPGCVVAWDARPARLYALEVIGLAAGVVVLAACGVALRRHLRRDGRDGRELANAIFLAMATVGVTSGLALAVLDRWASSWGATVLAPYVRSVVNGTPRAEYVATMPFVVRLHVFSAFAAIAALPFTTAAASAAYALARRRARQATPVREESADDGELEPSLPEQSQL